MDSTSVEPYIIVDTTEKIPECFIEINLSSIFFKAGLTRTILGSYTTKAQECVWSGDQLSLSSIRLKTGTNDTNYLTLDLKYEDIERIDYYFGANCLKIFVKIRKSTMDEMRAILSSVDHNYEIRFDFDSDELIERYLTVFFNLSDKSEVFVQWLSKVLQKMDPNFTFNRINFDLSVGVVLEDEIKRLNKELAENKKAYEELLAQFNNFYVQDEMNVEYEESEERLPEPRG